MGGTWWIDQVPSSHYFWVSKKPAQNLIRPVVAASSKPTDGPCSFYLHGGSFSSVRRFLFARSLHAPSPFLRNPLTLLLAFLFFVDPARPAHGRTPAHSSRSHPGLLLSLTTTLVLAAAPLATTTTNDPGSSPSSFSSSSPSCFCSFLLSSSSTSDFSLLHTFFHHLLPSSLNPISPQYSLPRRRAVYIPDLVAASKNLLVRSSPLRA